MITITLTQRPDRPTPPDEMTVDELYEAARSAWKFGRRAEKERYALVIYRDKVLQAIEIDHLEDTDEPGRRAIHGRPLGPGDSVHEAWVGKDMEGTRNPIRYFDAPQDRTPCLCGCGRLVIGDFVAGHDQRAIHERIAKIGSVAQFIRWFDRHHDDTNAA